VLAGYVVVRIELLEDFLIGMAAHHIDDFVGGQSAVWCDFLPIRFEPDLRLAVVNLFCLQVRMSCRVPSLSLRYALDKRASVFDLFRASQGPVPLHDTLAGEDAVCHVFWPCLRRDMAHMLSILFPGFERAIPNDSHIALNERLPKLIRCDAIDFDTTRLQTCDHLGTE